MAADGGPVQVAHNYALRDEEEIARQEELAAKILAQRRQWFPATNLAFAAMGDAMWESLPERPRFGTPQFLKLPLRVVGVLPPIDHTVPTSLNTGQRCEWYRDEGKLYKSLEVREPPPRVVFEEAEEPAGCCARPPAY